MTILDRLKKIAEGKCTGLLAEEAKTLLAVVEAIDKMLPEVDDFLFASDDDQAIWTSYMSRLGDLLDELEATP